jgi:hypothetical protein
MTAPPRAQWTPCSLVTTDESEEALGSPVGDGEAQDFPPVYGCTYRTEDGVGLVAVSVVVFDDADQAEAVYDLAIDNNDYPEIDGSGARLLRFGIRGYRSAGQLRGDC